MLWVLARLRSDDDACECGRCDDARDAELELTLLSTPPRDDGDSCLKQTDTNMYTYMYASSYLASTFKCTRDMYISN